MWDGVLLSLTMANVGSSMDDDDDNCHMSQECIQTAMESLGFDCMDYVSDIIPECLDGDPEDETGSCNEQVHQRKKSLTPP